MQYRFENCVLDTQRRELWRADALVAVEPQVFDLLRYLVENRDRVVSRTDILAAVWDGRAVSESTLASRINAARRAIDDNGKDQRLIRTAARKGVRFVAEVRDDDAAPAPAPLAETAPQPVTDRPSIAVLPFEDLTGDRAVELMADALVEDVIALLARVPGFFVIARASSFGYRRRAVEPQQIGAELGVRYIVSGSVRAAADQVRIVVQLVEADSGRHLWDARFDVAVADTLALQDEIARRIMAELEPALTKAEVSVIRRRRSDNLDAWSHYRQAVGAIMLDGWNENTIGESLRQLRLAIAADPDFALAHALLGLLSAFGANLSLVEDGESATRDARAAAETAVVLDPHASDVLGYAGCALSDIGEPQRGLEHLERAVALDPSNAQARVALGAAQTRLARYDDGIDNMRLGMRLSPQDFRLTFWAMILADALVRAGRLDEALAEAAGACQRDGRLYGARVVAAWALVRLERPPQEARHYLAEARRIRPHLTLDEVRRFFGKRAAMELEAVWE